MKPRPVINLEEFIGKTVGRRLPPKDPLRVSDSNKAMAISLGRVSTAIRRPMNG